MDGLLLIDKPAGMTSMDVIRRVRKALGMRKVGHTGTLDPAATGLLPVTLGGCTKLANFLSLEPKVYSFEVVFGTLTETADNEGAVVETGRVDVGAEELSEVLPRFTGDIMQAPPRFSAVKVGGRRAYELARAGEEFELPARPIFVHSLELLGLADGVAQMQVTCGSGTYVRALAVDIAAELATVAHARHIRRLRVGTWTIDDAIELDDVDAAKVKDPLTMMAELPRLELSDAERGGVVHGNSFSTKSPGPDGPCGLVWDGGLIAVADRRGDTIQPRRVLVE